MLIGTGGVMTALSARYPVVVGSSSEEGVVDVQLWVSLGLSSSQVH